MLKKVKTYLCSCCGDSHKVGEICPKPIGKSIEVYGYKYWDRVIGRSRLVSSMYKNIDDAINIYGSDYTVKLRITEI